jgi:23S rRNA (adenine2503-C2)-methyltransferase
MMIRMSTHLLDHFDDTLSAWLAQRSEAAYRAAQVRRWVFEKRAEDFAAMSDLPQPLRAALAQEFTLWTSRVVTHQRADDGTEKLLLEWPDGHRIECVLLRQGPQRRTICISTQVGCAMGCVFCASGLDGVARNLTRGEIVEQMLRLDRLLSAEERLSHIVVMGMGEPLANLDALLGALAEATSPRGLGISGRRVTISTVGLPAAIRRLAALDVQYHLAVSLHAPDDALRNQLVPVNAKIGVEAILQAAEEYFAATGRRLTFEYVLLGGINDQPKHARQLLAVLRGRTALLNVIPYNPVAGLPYQTPAPEQVSRFVEILERGGIAVKVRQRKGDKIDAACGQLRRRSSLESRLQPVLESRL